MSLVAVDAHVHLHGDGESALRTAARNFVAGCGFMPDVGILMLTESEGANRFAELRSRAADRRNRAIEIAGDGCLWWMADPRLPLLLVAGRQIVTAEGLEVLALGTEDILLDGSPVAEVVRWCLRRRAVPVLPWGVGKWVGRRGQLVSDLLSTANRNQLMLGDNAGRPVLWKVPAFAEARRRGSKVLPGSDPLPVAGGEHSIGSYGFTMRLSFDRDDPRGSVLDAIRASDIEITPFGRPSRLHRQLFEQVALRVRRPFRTRPAV